MKRTLTRAELHHAFAQPWCTPAYRMLIDEKIRTGEWTITDSVPQAAQAQEVPA